jgi:hypothetical protein
MYIYTVQAMRGQKPKFVGDTSVKYQVRRVNTSLAASAKGRSDVIRTNLEYEDAVKLVEGFNQVEGKSQNIREEVARQKSAE